MKIRRKTLLAAVAAGTSLLLAVQPASTQQAAPLTAEQAAQIVASPDRSAADRTNDLRRKPEQMLVFIGIRPGITALDLSAGRRLHDRAAGPGDRALRHRLWPEPAARSQPAADAAGGARGQQQSDRHAQPATGNASRRATALTRGLGRTRQGVTERRHQGRADHRSHPAVRRSRSARVGDRALRSRDLDVQLSRPRTSRRSIVRP